MEWLAYLVYSWEEPCLNPEPGRQLLGVASLVLWSVCTSQTIDVCGFVLLKDLMFTEGTEDSLLQDNITGWDMFGSSPNYEESFASSVLDHLRQAIYLIQWYFFLVSFYFVVVLQILPVCSVGCITLLLAWADVFIVVPLRPKLLTAPLMTWSHIGRYGEIDSLEIYL